ncbi:MAG: glycosyltransferase family 2 protein [Nanoarchaeota archaeon]
MGHKDVWIVIPARNEEKNIVEIIKKTKKIYPNVVVVDDGSDDQTSSLAEKNGAIVLKHIVNMGKGAALKTGCDYVSSKNAKFIVVMDADGQHKPEDISRLLKKLKKTDIVFGYRRLNKNMPPILKFGNLSINNITKLLYNIDLQDTQCGFRAFTKQAYKKIRWKAQDYSMESEMIANTGKYRLRYSEVPIETIYVDRYKGTTILDGIKIVINMFLWKLKR